VVDSGEEVAQIQEENCEEAQVQEEGITVFNSDHIIYDPGLCIPIDHFAPNIRDGVRIPLITKGTTQPIGHKFPQLQDKRSFRIKRFKQHSWLEYSLEMNNAYYFNSCLFKHDLMDDKFCYDAFIKLGFLQWKCKMVPLTSSTIKSK
jgi:hypothetical protein